jgi:large subunit ribosomal protein L30
MSIYAAIRMKGKFSLSPSAKTTLESLNLTRLYACTLVPGTDSYLGMLQSAKDSIAYGEVDEKAISILLSRRGLLRDGKKLSAAKKPEEIAKLAKEIAGSQKPLSQHSLLPMFFLSPPKGGFGASRKMAAGNGGLLGKNSGIGNLIEIMA